ncbi:uncharacterized protein LOC125228738 [Leguminivora glycinivorella]|uniref:uncharacterized protein LOC125228738 n=1 Tax=Leguminivora glycinivorella TaxID=1035111 RepID=UPI00200CD5E5|nr:uncharacterized protein LOC125228738 [Leguminivora glycinivorella]XP_047989360.1 uncharacterized protein LOC125228738 [Leguminivora glycinivorella]
MASLKLEGPTLGHKHRSFNKLVQKFTANQTRDNLEDNHLKENDIHNLVKIDIAGANRDVHYILEILKGNDMLYVSHALRRSSWLMTDDTYAHIMNSEYVHACLIPNMMAKAASKLMLHIRLNLRDEKRVDDFFNYYEPHDLKTALKWLPHCSVAFMNTKVEKYYNDIDPLLLKRLCEKSYQILKVYLKKPIKEFYYQKHANETFIRKGLQATIFLLNTQWDFYLDVIESIKTQAKYTRRESWRINVNRGNLALEKKYNGKPVFNVKLTKLLMKTCPERIKRNFYHYGNNIHIPTFVKFLAKYKIREFLLSQANDPNQDFGNTWIDFDTVQHFLKRMPREERIDFIRGIFYKWMF